MKLLLLAMLLVMFVVHVHGASDPSVAKEQVAGEFANSKSNLFEGYGMIAEKIHFLFFFFTFSLILRYFSNSCRKGEAQEPYWSYYCYRVAGKSPTCFTQEIISGTSNKVFIMMLATINSSK